MTLTPSLRNRVRKLEVVDEMQRDVIGHVVYFEPGATPRERQQACDHALERLRRTGARCIYLAEIPRRDSTRRRLADSSSFEASTDAGWRAASPACPPLNPSINER